MKILKSVKRKVTSTKQKVIEAKNNIIEKITKVKEVVKNTKTTVLSKLSNLLQSGPVKDAEKNLIIALTTMAVNILAHCEDTFKLFAVFAISLACGVLIWTVYLLINSKMLDSWNTKPMEETIDEQFDSMKVFIRIFVALVLQVTLTIINKTPFVSFSNAFNFIASIWGASYITDQIMRFFKKIFAINLQDINISER